MLAVLIAITFLLVTSPVVELKWLRWRTALSGFLFWAERFTPKNMGFSPAKGAFYDRPTRQI
jgi:hypothetical protein